MRRDFHTFPSRAPWEQLQSSTPTLIAAHNKRRWKLSFLHCVGFQFAQFSLPFLHYWFTLVSFAASQHESSRSAVNSELCKANTNLFNFSFHSATCSRAVFAVNAFLAAFYSVSAKLSGKICIFRLSNPNGERERLRNCIIINEANLFFPADVYLVIHKKFCNSPRNSIRVLGYHWLREIHGRMMIRLAVHTNC